MATEKKEIRIQDTEGTYRFQCGKSLITLKFAQSEGAQSMEQLLANILIGRRG